MSTTLTAHPLADLIRPMLTDEEIPLERDIQEHGQRQPITLFEGQILDGRHRYAICQKLGITPTFTTFEGTEAEAKALVFSLNVHRRHLDLDDRKRLIEDELRRDPEQSNRALAEVAKVSPTTVGKIRAKAVAKGMVSTVDTITGKDGVKQPAKKAITATVPTPADEKRTLTSASWPRNAGPVAIAKAILDALGNDDLAGKVSRQLEKQVKKARRRAATTEVAP